MKREQVNDLLSFFNEICLKLLKSIPKYATLKSESRCESAVYNNLEYDKTLVKCNPSARQITLEQMEFYAFAHFTINTFTDKEWGDGTESASLFNPTELNADQWVDSLKSAGARGLILTCKHYDGFCLWPSAYTEHSVKNSPFRSGRGDCCPHTPDADIKT